MALVKIDKRYKIEFSYAGVSQSADFHEVNGELHNPRLFVNWSRAGEIPDVSHCKTINEVLELIKSFAYGKKAKITRINGMPVFYYKKKKTQQFIEKISLKYDEFVKSQAILFFNTEIKPLLIKNDWKISSSHLGLLVLIYKNKDGEWDNVRNKDKEFEFEFLCSEFLRAVGEERRDGSFSVGKFLSLVGKDQFKDEFYVEF